jgi:hypothetical protein
MTGDVLPETMSLKASRKQWAIVAMIGLPFLFAAIFAPAEWWISPLARWLVFGFFALLTLTALPGAFGWRAQLDLDRTGFSCVTLFSTWRRSWSDCTEFAPIMVGTAEYVGFTNARDERRYPVMAFASWMTTGSTGMLPETYGHSARALADLMNGFRARALGSAT